MITSRSPQELSEILVGIDQMSLPPVHKWQSPLSGDMDLRILSDGRWVHEGGVITRPKLVKLLSSVLRRDGDEYFLVSPSEKWRIVVEDAPFVVVEMQCTGVHPQQDNARQHAVGQNTVDTTILLRTNTDEWLACGAAHRICVTQRKVGLDSQGDQSSYPRPYVHVRDSLWALINRNVYYELAELAHAEQVNGRDVLGVSSNGVFHALEP